MQDNPIPAETTTFWHGLVGILVIVALAVTGLNLFRYGLTPFDSAGLEDQTNPVSGPEATVAGDDTSTTLPIPNTDELSALVSGQNNQWVVGLQQNHRFTLSGQIGDQQTKDLLEESMRETYGDLATSELIVNPRIEVAPWTLSASNLFKEVAVHMIDGGFAIGNGDAHFVGTTPNQASRTTLKDALSGIELTLFDQLELANLNSPTLSATHKDGRLFMSGRVPNQDTLDELTQSATDLYGADNVTSNLLVDKTTFAPIALARWQENLVLFFPFGDYRIQIMDGTFTGELRGGLVFERGSADLTEEGREFLDIFPTIINRSNGQVTVLGHTDNSGSQALNQSLSQQRAEAVTNYLISKEIPDERITAEGKGDSDPTASNNSEEGRQQNRRVEIVVSP